MSKFKTKIKVAMLNSLKFLHILFLIVHAPITIVATMYIVISYGKNFNFLYYLGVILLNFSIIFLPCLIIATIIDNKIEKKHHINDIYRHKQKCKTLLPKQKCKTLLPDMKFNKKYESYSVKKLSIVSSLSMLGFFSIISIIATTIMQHNKLINIHTANNIVIVMCIPPILITLSISILSTYIVCQKLHNTSLDYSTKCNKFDVIEDDISSGFRKINNKKKSEAQKDFNQHKENKFFSTISKFIHKSTHKKEIELLHENEPDTHITVKKSPKSKNSILSIN